MEASLSSILGVMIPEGRRSKSKTPLRLVTDLHSSREVRSEDSEMSGLRDSIIPHLGAPMQINHIITSLLPLQWLILASGRAKGRVISRFWSTPGSVSVLRHERGPLSSTLIPLIGVFLSQSPSHCSPRLHPVAFSFIIFVLFIGDSGPK